MVEDIHHYLTEKRKHVTTIGKTISNLVVKFAVPEYPPHVADEMLDIPIEALP